LQIQAVSLVAEERTILGSYVGSAVPNRDIPRPIALYRTGRLPVDALFTRASISAR
jgi:alcohol dehydrogenase